MDEALQERRARLLLQVHDELVVEAPKDDAEYVAEKARNIMETAVDMSVPLKVDVGVGQNWADIR